MEHSGSVILSRLKQFQLDWKFQGKSHHPGGIGFEVHYEDRRWPDKCLAQRIRRHHFSGFSPQYQFKSAGTISCERSFLSGVWIVVSSILSFDLGMMYFRVSHSSPVETDKCFTDQQHD